MASIRRNTTVAKNLLGFDKVDFTAHARDRMKQRGISQADIFHAIEKPDETGLNTIPGRHRVRWRKGQRHAIDVIYELRSDRVCVITTFRVTLDSPQGKPPPKVFRMPGPPGKTKRKNQRRKR